MSQESLKICVLKHVLNLVVSNTDVSSFDKLFHQAGPAYDKARFQSLGEGRVVLSWCWLMNVAGGD